MGNDLKTKRMILTLVVFLTSVSFLAYEVTWNRILGLYLGTTVHASTIVISAFMGGLGIGAYFWGKSTASSEHPVKILTFIILALSIINIITYHLLMFIPDIYGILSSDTEISLATEIIVYSYSLLCILGSAFFIGGIMPAASRIYIELGNGVSDSLGNTYAADTLGSAVGGMLTGFVLLGLTGMSGTVYIFSILNIFIAVFFFKYFNKINFQPVTEEKQKSKKEKYSDKIYPKTALIITFVSGLVALLGQVIWMRIFKVYLTNTSYTFGLITSVIIFGYFTGSLIYKKIDRKEIQTVNILMASMLFMGVFVIIGTAIFANAPKLLILPLHFKLTSPVTRILIPPFLMSLITVLPPSIISGIAFPAACKVYNNNKGSISSGLGKVYFFNTIGGFIGPFLAAFIMIPFVGSVRSLLIASIMIFLTVLIISTKLKILNFTANIITVILIFIPLFYIFKAEIMILPPSFAMEEREILFYKETLEANLVVGKDKTTGMNYTYFNNNAVIGSSYDAIKAVKLLGHLPFITGHNPKNVLIVGFGIGVTTSTILQHEEVKSVECVELAKELEEAAKYYSDLNNNVTADPRLKIIGNDGRHYLQATGKKYDLISSDPTHPVLGSGNLYSSEYFQLCYDHLTENGMVTQYLPMHKLLPKDYAGIIKTFNSVFENTTIWLGHTHTLIIGTKKPMKIDFMDFKLNAAKINDQYLYNNTYSLASFLAIDNNSIDNLTKGSEICHDNRSYLDFFEMNSFLPENWALNAENIYNNIKPTDVFYNVDNEEMLNRFRKSTKIVLEGLMQSMSGNPRGYIEKLYEALDVTPENQEISFLIKLESKKKGD